VKIARKGEFKEKPQNSHPYEFARNGICKKINNWNLQGPKFARKKNLQGTKLARNGGGICKK